MKYFIDEKNVIYGYEEDGSQDDLIGKKKPITEEEVQEILNPPPSQEEIIATAEANKQQLIDQANDYMNSKQWPGKAVLGRLKSNELAQYNEWLDYLDALEVVETSVAPNLEWPTPPAQAQLISGAVLVSAAVIASI